MASNGECFHECELIIFEVVADVQLAGGDDEAVTQAAVRVDAHYLKIIATVGQAFTAGITIRIVDVGFNAAAVTGFYVSDAIAYGDDFDAELVSRNTGIREERHLAEITAHVRAANADAVHADKGFTCCRAWWFRDVDGFPATGLGQAECFHGGFHFYKSN